jgi:PAS domain S-box-containing protein
VYRAAFSYAGLYMLFCGALLACCAWMLATRLISLTQLPPDLAALHLRRLLRPAPVYGLAILFFYSVLGVVAVDASMVELGASPGGGAVDHASHIVGATIPVLATAPPLFFLVNTTLDRYFTPRGVVSVVTSLHTKLLVSSLISPLFVDIMLLAYFCNRGGGFDLGALWMWAVLLAFSVAGFLLGLSDLRRVLAPLQDLISGRLAPTRAMDLLQPRSLDELGVVMSRLLGHIAREEALRKDLNQLSERLIQAAYATGLGVFDHDLRKDSLYWTADVYRIFGVPPGEPVTLSAYLDIIHPDDRERAAILFARAREPDGSRRYDIEHRIVRRDGQVRWVALHSQTFFTDEALTCRPVRVVGAVLDITDRVEVETRRRVLEAELQEARRLESIGTFASGIAHDFNNILAIINGNLEGARQVLPRDHAALRHLSLIGLAARRGLDLTAQISQFARGQRQMLLRTPIGPVVQESMRLVCSAVPPKVSIVVETGECDFEVLSAPGQLQQVICNLATNAIQALGQRGGSVWVAVRAATLPDTTRSAPEVCHPGIWTVISVADTGCGMTEEVRRRIFEPFFTTRPTGSGTGLGLAVVEGIVRSLGGTVGVRSTPGEGSTFEIWLPALEASRLPDGARRPAALLAARSRLLCIEDDQLFADTLSHQLRERGWIVAVETSPFAALTRLRAAPSEFDAVVTDYRMPERSGVQVIEAVRSMDATMPIVMLTGQADAQLWLQARTLGALAVIEKSPDMDTVIDDIERILLAPAEGLAMEVIS